MFEKMSEKEARDKILGEVAEYAQRFHPSEKPYEQGGRINYAGRYYDGNEMVNLVDSALEFWLTTGRYTNEFEHSFSQELGVQYVSLVNSGSSANLLAFATLTSPLLGDRRIKRGDEVITVAAGFPTTVAPIIRYGAVPVFVDVTIPEYNIDVSMLGKALTEKTRAVMIAHTLGNPFDLKEVKDFCKRNDLWLVEDNCDALGSKYTIDGVKRFTGTIGDIGTSSFYPPHHITMGEGGAVYTNDPLLNKIARSMRDWGRDCSCPSGMDNTCGHRYDGQYGQLPAGYDHKYVYSHFGYNLKATDMQAAIGCAQLKKLPMFTKKRRDNFEVLMSGLKDLEDKLILPRETKNSEPSWFGFIMTVQNGADRKKIVPYIEKEGVQTRMLFAGNLIKHPCFDEIRDTAAYRVVGDLPVTDRIMEDSFWIGLGPSMDADRLNRMIEVIHRAVKETA